MACSKLASASPNRLNGLYGAGRSARLAGDASAAKSYYEKIVSQCSKADGAVLSEATLPTSAGGTVAAMFRAEAGKVLVIIAQLWLVLVGGTAAHISVNALNEYLDFRSGLDARTVRTPFSGGSGALAYPRVAMASVMLCATVKAVIVATRRRTPSTRISSASTNSR